MLAQIIIKETNTILRRADIIKYLNMYKHMSITTVIINIELENSLLLSPSYAIFLRHTLKSV